MKNYDIVTISDVCADLLLFGSDIMPEFGQKEKLGSRYYLTMGGSCGIFASQAAKLGLKTAVVGTLADDVIGRMLLEKYRECGVITEHLRFADSYTAMSVAHCKGTDRAIITLPGCMDSTAAEDIPPTLLRQTRHLHIASFYILRKMWPGWGDVIRSVKAAGGTVSLDTNYDPEERWDIPELMDILPMVDIFFPNETELCSIMRESDPMAALDRAAGIVPVCVMKRGGLGAAAVAHGKSYAWPAEKVSVVDTVGAGDTFDAGFLFGCLNGLGIQASGQIATFCGAGNVQRLGGVDGQPKLCEVAERFQL